MEILYQTESFLTAAFLWCMSKTSCDRVNSRRVWTHEKNSGDVFADWAQWYKAFFVPNQEPASTWIFGNGPVRVGTQGLFHPYLKTFILPFLPTDWLPLQGLQGWLIAYLLIMMSNKDYHKLRLISVIDPCTRMHLIKPPPPSSCLYCNEFSTTIACFINPFICKPCKTPYKDV